MKSIGIDIGTTTISLVVVEDDGTLVQKNTIRNDSFLPSEQSWQRMQDVQNILNKTMDAVENMLTVYEDIAAIGLTGQMHGILYIDNRGEAVSPLYTWQDESGNQPDFDGASICEILKDQYQVNASTGYGMVTYIYHSKTGLVPESAVSFCTIADFIGMKLTERKKPLIHISQAAGMGLFDIEKYEFMWDVLQKIRVDTSLVPDVTEKFVSLGGFRGIPVTVSVGDNQASFLGSVEKKENTLLVNVGTGAQVSVLSKHIYERDGIETRPLTEDSFLLVGATLCGGAAFAALENFFRMYAVAAGAPDVPQYEIMKDILNRQPDSLEAWKVKTTFSGTRENPHETGAIQGISRDNFHPAAFIRGVLNGMTEELYQLYLALKEEVDITRIVASGNGIRKNTLLRDIIQRRFGMPVEIIQMEEEAAFGAASIAIKARK